MWIYWHVFCICWIGNESQLKYYYFHSEKIQFLLNNSVQLESNWRVRGPKAKLYWLTLNISNWMWKWNFSENNFDCNESFYSFYNEKSWLLGFGVNLWRVQSSNLQTGKKFYVLRLSRSFSLLGRELPKPTQKTTSLLTHIN